MVDNPLGTFTEQGRAWVNEDKLVVGLRLESFRRIFTCNMIEEACGHSLPNLSIVLHVKLSTRYYWKTEPFHNRNQLSSNILSSLHCSSLDEIFVTPAILAPVLLPSFIDGQKSQMVSILMIKLSSFLISQILLLLWSVEHILDRYH